MKLSFTKIICVFWIFIASSVSCVNNSEEELYGDVPCDLENVTWVSRIADILDKNCVMCHGPEIAYKGVRHDSYEAEMVVVNDGRLRGVVNHLPGYVQMPKDRGKLPDCELKQINNWLDNGAPEF